MIRESKALSGTESTQRLLMDSDWFYCSCLLWGGHIMDNSWTFFLRSPLQRFYAPYSYILASTETPVPKYKDWVTLSAGSGYMLFFFFLLPKLPQLWQHKAPPLHIKTHIHTTTSFSTRPNVKLYQGCQLLPTWPYSFLPPPQQAAIRACSDSSAFDIYIATEF